MKHRPPSVGRSRRVDRGVDERDREMERVVMAGEITSIHLSGTVNWMSVHHEAAGAFTVKLDAVMDAFVANRRNL